MKGDKLYMKEIENYNEVTFESIKHIDEYGNEYWEARELMPLLEYSKWENFHKVIKRAKIACETSNNNINDHFPEFRKPIVGGKGNVQNVIDYHLSRYACYLIVQNANPRKKSVALGQTYFAIQTRKQEINELEYSKLTEDEKRLYTRILVNNKNKYLFKTARESGVENFGKFNNYGYKGLYNGETAKQIAKRKNINDKEDILDYMGSEELGANLFRITQTEAKLKKDNIDNEDDACLTHYNVGRTVRKAIEELGGNMPEELPTPKKSIKEIEKEELQKIEN
jgi:DNA-damage-inducible protein D